MQDEKCAPQLRANGAYNDTWCARHEYKGAGETPVIVLKGGNMK